MVETRSVGDVDMQAGPFESRQNLVIVRAGDASLHPQWLAGPVARNWDLVVSYFGKDPDRYRAPDIVRVDSVGPKWHPLQQLLTDRPELLDRYKYIWLPDDDLEMSTVDMNRFFDICHQYDLELAQPSLSADSPMNQPLLIRNAACHLRYSNFVEVMAPCFRADFLRRAIPTFSATQSGWGLDWLWPRMVTNPETGIAVVDDVVVRHTRPLGGPNYDAMRQKGELPLDELQDLLARENITSSRIEFHKVLWRSRVFAPTNRQSLLFRTKLLLGFGRAYVAAPHRKVLAVQSVGRFMQPVQGAATNKITALIAKLQYRLLGRFVYNEVHPERPR